MHSQSSGLQGRSSSKRSKYDSNDPMHRIRSLLRRSEVARWLTLGQCLILSVPAVLFLWMVFGIAQNNTDVRKRHTARLAEYWKELGGSGNEEALILAGKRLIGTGSLGNEDYFRLFDAYVGTGRSDYAVRLLESLESFQAASGLAEYRAGFAEKLIELKPPTLEYERIALEKLQKSLVGPLSKASEKKVRVALASLAKATGNADVFMSLLQPLAFEDREIATELIWSQWLRSIDEEPSRIRNSAMEQFDRLKLDAFQRVVQTTEKPAESVYMQLARLHFVSGRQEDFLIAIRELPSTGAELGTKIQNAFDEMRVIEEVSRKNPRSRVYTTTLVKILNRENVDKSWVDLASRLWASQNLSPIDPLRLWMKNYQNSPKADYEFFLRLAQTCHANSRWDDARAMYEKAIEKNPESLVALNNLAAMYYRFPPRDLDKALALSNQALKVQPDMIGVEETRAQVLARLGKIEEARIILESALPVYPQEWNIHNTLAQIYAIQGKQELGEIHAARAAELKRPPGSEFYEKLELAASPGRKGEVPVNAKPEAAAKTKPKPTDR